MQLRPLGIGGGIHRHNSDSTTTEAKIVTGAAGPQHHAVPACAVNDAEDDPTALELTCLNVAPLRCHAVGKCGVGEGR